MAENPRSLDLMARLARVDGKLEKWIGSQPVMKDQGPAAILDQPDAGYWETMLPDPSEDTVVRQTSGFSAGSKKPLPYRVAVSPLETESIFEKIDKINRDAEVMWRVEKLERQNRIMIILGSLSITMVMLMMGVFTFLMFQANLVNQGGSQTTAPRITPSQPSSGEAAARVTVPQSPKPMTEVPDPKPAEPTARVSDPQPVPAPPAPKPAETTSPGKYVGFTASNKYHNPGCKWAAGIQRYRHQTFSSAQEARGHGYIPCPTCKPLHSD
jgi:hypothetical protein